MQLGDLEKLVQQHLWDNEPADAKQVYAHFDRIRGGTLNTYQSTLERLFNKGLLSREKLAHAFQYRPAVNRDRFVGHQ